MSALASFLRAERDTIIGMFTARTAAAVAPRSLPPSVLIDHLPEQLDRLASLLEAGISPEEALHADSERAKAHGEQRLRNGFDLDQMVEEFAILRDCVFDRMKAAKCPATLEELHVLTNRLSASQVISVRQYLEESGDVVEEQRRTLLGLFEQSPGFLAFVRGPAHVFELENVAYQFVTGGREVIGKSVREALPELAGQGFYELLDRVYTTGQPFIGRGASVRLQRTPNAPLEHLVMDFIYQPIRGRDGAVCGVLIQGQDLTEVHRQEQQRIAMEEALRVSEQRLRTVMETIDDGYCLIQVLYDQSGRPSTTGFSRRIRRSRGTRAWSARSGRRSARWHRPWTSRGSRSTAPLRIRARRPGS